MAQSYSNPGGSGRRDHQVLTRTNETMGAFGDNSLAYMVDGSTTENATWLPNGSNSGKYLLFDFGSPRVVTEAKWYQDNSTTHGVWKWQGSNDDSTYTDIGSSFTMGGTAQLQTELNGNSTAYRWYKLAAVSGSSSDSPFTREIEFKIDDLVTTVPDYGNTGGSGDRSASITVTQSQSGGHGDLFVGRFNSADPTLSLFVDGINRIDTGGAGALVFRTATTSAASGRWLQFQFPSPVVIDQLRWFQDTTDTHGTWKLQGSNDGSSWTDVGSSATLGGSVDNHRFAAYVGSPGTQFFVQSIFDGCNGNTTAYLYYRLLGVSGNVSGTPFIYEIAFRIAESNILYGIFAATADPLLSFAGFYGFTGTADPLAAFQSVLVHGYFVAVADPLLSVTPGYVFFRASPTASFLGVDNAYTSMGFTAPADPRLAWVGLENQAVNAVFMAHPQLIIFVPVGQSGRCASGEGVGHRDSSTPTNYVF